MRARLLALTVLAACGGDDAARPDAAVAPYCQAKTGTNLTLTLITDQLANPVAITAPAGDPRLFVAEQPGRISIVKDGALLPTPFLTIDVMADGGEEGLLGLAFHPDYRTNGRFFVTYTIPGSTYLRIAEYHADPASDTADPTEKTILELVHPASNHNGGSLAFDPDGYLYASFGDGGGGNDTFGNGQNPDARLAKILRFDVDAGDPYAVPPSNPWAGGGGVTEMFVWGLRNPWKFSFDQANGDLWIGDVGQDTYEEVDVVRHGTSGQNFGWPVFEASGCFTADASGNLNCDHPEDYVMPVMSYDRTASGQCTIIAGGVYRGACMPDYVGQFFFSDYCVPEIRTFDATVDAVPFAETVDHTADVDPTGVLASISSFGTDGYGELYVAALASGSVYRIEVE